MRVFGHHVGNNAYIGRSTNEGFFDRNTISPEVSSTVAQKGDTFVMRDTDANPNLKAEVSYNPFSGASLNIVNSDEKRSANGGEHVVQASFPLPHMSQEAAQELRSEDLTRDPSVDYISVSGQDGRYQVEIGEFGPGKIHNAFFISDGPVARARGGI